LTATAAAGGDGGGGGGDDDTALERFASGKLVETIEKKAVTTVAICGWVPKREREFKRDRP